MYVWLKAILAWQSFLHFYANLALHLYIFFRQMEVWKTSDETAIRAEISLCSNYPKSP